MANNEDGMPQVPRRLVLWSDIPSHHQAPWIKLLATNHGFDLTYVVMESIGASERASQGWPETDLSTVDVRVMPSALEIRSLVAERKDESLHVITGGFVWPTSRMALRECLRTRADFAILAEPPFPYSKFYVCKNLLQRVFCKVSGRRVKGIWAIGRIAYDFYRAIGYKQGQVFEWAYFPPVPSELPARAERSDSHLFYVGQFNSRKGVDLLVEALVSLKHKAWTATLVGGGEMSPLLNQMVEKAGLVDRIEFVPFKPYSEAMALLAQADLVVVPSRHDGWGAVVNEAIGYGIPVVCTDRCGSLDLVTRNFLGSVCKAGDAGALAEAMTPWIKRGPLSDAARQETHKWAMKSISPEVGAAYFAEMVKFAYGAAPRPTRPWA